MNKIVTLTGMSGSGKSTIERLLCENNPEFHKCISHTSRSKRDGETDGIDYHYVDKAFFEENKFIEFTEFSENFYGLHENELRNDKINVLVAEVNGVKQIIDNKSVETFTVFISVSQEVAAKRMMQRGDSIAQIDKRLAMDNINDMSSEVCFELYVNSEEMSADEIVSLIKTKLLEKWDV